MPDWYYAKAGKQYGPVTPTQLKQMAQSGELLPDDLVFQEGGTQWVSASTVKGLFGPSTGVRSNAAPRAEPERSAPDDRDAEPVERVARSAGPPSERGKYWLDLLLFRRLIAPTIIMILFWLGVAGVLINSLVGLVGGLIALFKVDALQGLLTIFLSILFVPFGILVVRLWCEMLIL